jgi:hypothetical protein
VWKPLSFSVFVVDVLLWTTIVSLRWALIHVRIMVRFVPCRSRLTVVRYVWTWLTVISSHAYNLILRLSIGVIVVHWLRRPAWVLVAVVISRWRKVMTTILHRHIVPWSRAAWRIEVFLRGCMINALISRVCRFKRTISLSRGLWSLCFVDTAALLFVSTSLRPGYAWCTIIVVITCGNTHVSVVARRHPLFVWTISTALRARPTRRANGIRCRDMAAILCRTLKL